MCLVYLEQLWKWPTSTTVSTICSPTQRTLKGWVGQLVMLIFLCCAATHRPTWTDGDMKLISRYVETSDEGPRGRASVLWRRVRRTWRLFRVRAVEATLARQGLWHDAERTLWLQTGRFLCSPERAVRALLWYVCKTHTSHPGEQRHRIAFPVMNDSVKASPLCIPGEGGVDGDGDITRPENVTAFRNFVMESTERRGLHFLMADGVRVLLQNNSCRGFSVWKDLKLM